MKIQIDGKEKKFNLSGVESLGALFGLIYDSVKKEGRVVSKIILDSKEISPEREEEIDGVSIEGYSHLDIGTKTPRDIAKESIEDGLLYIDHLEKELREVVGGLRSGSVPKFGRRLMECLEDLTDFLELFISVKETSAVDLGKISIDGKKVDDIETLMLSAIKETVSTREGDGVEHAINSIEMILLPVLDLFRRCMREIDRLMGVSG